MLSGMCGFPTPHFQKTPLGLFVWEPKSTEQILHSAVSAQRNQWEKASGLFLYHFSQNLQQSGCLKLRSQLVISATQEMKAVSGTMRGGVGQNCSHKIVRKSLSDLVAPEQTSGGSKGASLLDPWKKHCTHRESNKCKGPEVEHTWCVEGKGRRALWLESGKC